MMKELLSSRWMRIPVGLLFGAVLGFGGLKAYESFGDDCCGPGAPCCYPGSPCCANNAHPKH